MSNYDLCNFIADWRKISMIYAILLTICIACIVIGGIFLLFASLVDFDIIFLNILGILLPIIAILCGATCGIIAIWNALL